MARRTTKVGVVGKLGPRYGVRIRKRIQEIEVVQRAKHSCPKCKAKSVKRISSGIWQCRRCGSKFAGGAYRPIVTTAIKREIPLKTEEGATEEEVETVEEEEEGKDV